ncbi:hypothetical protein N0B44_18535 [Roseibacterium beibuensis]|uniref:hypothetical protein n=1 Tax=[Roseibacterium] beibuensis TaxID=1193142 RepID=UPI00217EDD0A|nr:hypothetical protein [Roseibacterium beibuensis]MCS6624916.1 hypothetical protein [Roseibacterium beibuensis]
MTLNHSAARGRCQTSVALLVLAGVFGVGGQAAAQSTPAETDVAARAERFRQCPAAGVQIHYRPVDGGDPASPGLQQVRPVEVWAGSAQWRPEPPLTDYVLLYPQAWTPLESLLSTHEDLRERAGRPLPTGSGRILLMEVINQFTTTVASIAAIRGGDGVWRIDRVEELDAGTDAPTFKAAAWVLPPLESTRLDSLLADPCLAAEPLHTAALTTIHVPRSYWLLEISGRDPSIRIGGADGGFGRAGGIRHLILTPRQDSR